MPVIDPAFSALPLDSLADAALGRARELGVRHAAFRLQRSRHAQHLQRDGRLRGSQDTTGLGLSVSVVHGGHRGFAADVELSPTAAARASERAVALARLMRDTGSEPVAFAAEPAHESTWISDYEVNPFDVPEAERLELMAGWSSRLLAAAPVAQVLAKFTAVQENKFYADLAGSRTTQQTVRVHPQLVALGATDDATHSLRTLGPRWRAAGNTSAGPAGTGKARSTRSRSCWTRACTPTRSPKDATTW
ncbi:PmbA/TldA family metallopeptidase [Saccharopolyspora sp. CA-218241]|uniref:PmbA/TldA family metallopeptidase n=1 Tax=Saccharopolyspora sp. CA-218241 TaxID=3240027 RepID=UPI003D96A494